jgi:hypothetical protein
MGDLGIEPAPCTLEAIALLQQEGIAPRPAPGEPLGPDDERWQATAGTGTQRRTRNSTTSRKYLYLPRITSDQVILNALVNPQAAMSGEGTFHLADGFTPASSKGSDGRYTGLRHQASSSTQPASAALSSPGRFELSAHQCPQRR